MTRAEEREIARLLAATDEESAEQLAKWLRANSKTWAPTVMKAAKKKPGISAEAACTVLAALMWRAPADEETSMALIEILIPTVADSINESFEAGITGTEVDALIDALVSVVTANRRARFSETAIGCLAQAGPGGALVLSRAFDTARSSSKIYIVKHLAPAEVLKLEDNVVASLANSILVLAEELEGRKKNVATDFVAALGPVEEMEMSEIGPEDPLEIGAPVFHATWGAGVVTAANDESVTIDFGNAGTRTLLRALATLRHGE